MSRLLLVVGLLLLVLWMLQRGAQTRRRQARRDDAPAAGASDASAPAIVPCAQCGVHLPQADAIEADGQMYCCPAHVSLARHGDR